MSPNQVEAFMSFIQQNYYFKKYPELKKQPEKLNDFMFASKPASGAGIFYNFVE